MRLMFIYIFFSHSRKELSSSNTVPEKIYNDMRARHWLRMFCQRVKLEF